MDELAEQLTEWRGLLKQGASLAPYREQITSMYWQVCQKQLRKCNCKDVLKDAVLEIYTRLKINGKMATKINDVTARLVAGVILRINGQMYTNHNLTDEAARAFLEQFPQRTDWFEVLPKIKAEAKVADTTENGAEIAPKAIKSESNTATPKKKKTAKKRK